MPKEEVLFKGMTEDEIRNILLEGICSQIVKGNWKWSYQYGVSIGKSPSETNLLMDINQDIIKPLVEETRRRIQGSINLMVNRMRSMQKMIAREQDSFHQQEIEEEL